MAKNQKGDSSSSKKSQAKSVEKPKIVAKDLSKVNVALKKHAKPNK